MLVLLLDALVILLVELVQNNRDLDLFSFLALVFIALKKSSVEHDLDPVYPPLASCHGDMLVNCKLE